MNCISSSSSSSSGDDDGDDDRDGANIRQSKQYNSWLPLPLRHPHPDPREAVQVDDFQTV